MAMDALEVAALDDAMRALCASEIAKHIDHRVKAKRLVLARGTPQTHAEWIVKRWALAQMKTFYVLLRLEEKDISKRALAEKVRMTPGQLDNFLTSLKKASVRVRTEPEAEDFQLRLFRSGRELPFSGTGIRMNLCLKLQDYDTAKHQLLTTGAATRAHNENAVQANDAMVADDSRSAEQRERDEREIATASGVQQVAPASSQLKLVSGGE